MKATLNKALEYAVFFNAIKDQKIPLKTAYKLASIYQSLQKEVTFYQDKMKQIIDKYAILDEDGNPVLTEGEDGFKVREGKENACLQEITELQDLEIELPDETITLEELDEVELTIQEIAAIMPYIKQN